MRSLNMKQTAIIGLIVLAMFGVGASVAWMQDTQYSKNLLGQVIDERTRQPVNGATVRVMRAGDAAREAQTDEDGRYRIGISNGALSVTVSARGYQTTSGPFQASDPLIKEFPLDVVLRPYTVSGVVKDTASQKPIVYAVLRSGDVSTQTAEDGSFTLSRIEPGAPLKVEAIGYYPHETQWNNTGTMDFALTARTIVIAVSNAADNKPLKAAVFVNGAKYQTDVQGRLTIREPALNTRISASLEDFAGAETAYNGQAVVELALKPGAFKAVVRNALTGKPVSGATVYVNGAATTTTSDEGRFGLPDTQPGATLKLKAAGYLLAETAVAGPTMEIALSPFVARGVYLPFGLLANESKVRGLIDMIDRTELNTLVVDVKGDRGKLAFRSTNPTIKALGTEDVTMDLRELLRIAHQRKIYVIARIVTFKDEPLTQKRPDLAVKSKSGKVWKDGEGLGWANPYSREVWDYNLAVAKEAAAMGFDEVQFDYIRFPSDGNVNDAAFPPPHTPETRAAALRGFLIEVNRVLKPYPVFVSADVFGMTVWTRDDMGIGQRLEEIAQRVDYIQPMIYPSTFSPNNLGYTNPSAHPYDVIFRSVKAAAERVATPVRPWLQAYAARNAPYGLKEFLLQKKAANDAGAMGWTFWNAGGQYDSRLFAGQ